MLESGSWGAVFFATLCSSILSQFAQPSGMKLFKIHVPDEVASIGMSATANAVLSLHDHRPDSGHMGISAMGHIDCPRVYERVVHVICPSHAVCA